MKLARLLFTILTTSLLLFGQQKPSKGEITAEQVRTLAPPPGEYSGIMAFSGPSERARWVLLPNRKITPGDYEDVPLSQLCVKGFAGRRRAAQYSQIEGGWKRIRRLAFRGYHVTDGTGACKSEGCEGDHLVPETLAGKTTLRNIWPQPFGDHPGAHEKDVLEVWAGREVCGKRMNLHDAQVKIASDWFSFYLEMERTVKH